MNSLNWSQQESPQQSNSTISKRHMPLRKHIRKQKNSQNSQNSEIQNLYKSYQFSEIVKITQASSDCYEEFEQLKINNEYIKIGDTVEITGEKHVFVGKIEQIIAIKEPVTNKFICLCLVNWYLTRNEILKYIPESKKWISKNELFQSDLREYVLASTIINQCVVTTIDEYKLLPEITTSTYFSRLKWIRQNEFDNTLETYCLCNQPFNPDQDYVQCDKCLKWYHIHCLEKPVDINLDFLCTLCN